MKQGKGYLNYIKVNGDLFVQTEEPALVGSLVRVHRGKLDILGEVVKNTKTGVVLRNWRITDSND